MITGGKQFAMFQMELIPETLFQILAVAQIQILQHIQMKLEIGGKTLMVDNEMLSHRSG